MNCRTKIAFAALAVLGLGTYMAWAVGMAAGRDFDWERGA